MKLGKWRLQPSANAKVLFVIAAAVITPTILTLRTVEDPGPLMTDFSANPTPYGYTVSLLIYIIPIVPLYWWLCRFDRNDFRRRAYRLTLLILITIGFFLDLAFGVTFFDFPNAGANVNVLIPGYSFAEGGFIRKLPIEEFVFYFTGFVVILLIYVWCDEYWFRLYNVDYDDSSKYPRRLLRLHRRSVVYGLLAILAAFLYKRFLAAEHNAGFPSYFTFLVVVGVIPSLLLFRATQYFINWRAFSLTFFWVLLTSVLWEATLASPYGWWRYHQEQMMGLSIGAWGELPFEAAFLWLIVTFTTVIFYEIIKLYGSMNISLRAAFIGSGPVTDFVKDFLSEIFKDQHLKEPSETTPY